MTILSGCKTFEYEADTIVRNENSIQVGNIGFKGYVLTPPQGYETVSIESLPANSQVRGWVEMLRIGYRNSEGISYHFHQDFIFSNGDQVIYFIPFQNKAIRQFRRIRPASDLLAKIGRGGYGAGHGNTNSDSSQWREAPPVH